MRRDEIVEKARGAIGHGTLYRLGAGAPETAPHPWDEAGACDCSGFVCWVLGISRFQPHLQFLKSLNGGWMNTDGMYYDASLPAGLFSPEASPEHGSLIVYPSHSYAKKVGLNGSGPRIGHVGILTDNRTVIHCSSSNFKLRGDAIEETDTEVFRNVLYTRYIRFVGTE